MNYKQMRNEIYKKLDVTKLNSIGIRFEISHLCEKVGFSKYRKPLFSLPLSEVRNSEQIILLCFLTEKGESLSRFRSNGRFYSEYGWWEPDHPRYCKWHPSGMTLEESFQKDLLYSHDWEKAWRTRDGEVIPYPEMKDVHIANILYGNFPLTTGVVTEVRKRFCHIPIFRIDAEKAGACSSGIARFLRLINCESREALTIGELTEYIFSRNYGDMVSIVIGYHIHRYLKGDLIAKEPVKSMHL